MDGLEKSCLRTHSLHKPSWTPSQETPVAETSSSGVETVEVPPVSLVPTSTECTNVTAVRGE